MASAPPMLPTGFPDFSCVKDFETEEDARILTEVEEPSSPGDIDDLPSEYKELEEKLQEIRKAPRKSTETARTNGDDDEPLKALYFVRIPKPDFDSPAYDLLQQEFNAQLTQCGILVEHRRVHSMKKSQAREKTSKALECLKEANARVKEQFEKLRPYRDQRDQNKRARGALKDSLKSLAVSTEQELDQLIHKLEFRMEHETMPLAEEKDLHTQIKRLKASRPKVREHEQKNAALSATIANRSLSPTEEEHLEKELKEFRAEQSMYEKMFRELRDEERKVGEELAQISSQLDLAQKKKDAIYAKLSEARNKRRMRKNEWQRNRDFSKRIRCLVDEGRVEEAQEECRAQSEALMTMFMTNQEYKQDYLELWSTKRPNPMAIFEETTTEKPKNTSSKPQKKKSTLHANLQVLPGQSIPDAVVADTLREATAAVHGTKPMKKSRAIEEPVPVQPLRTQAVPVDAIEKEKETPISPVKEKKPVINDDFELPAVVLGMKKEPEIPAEIPERKSIDEALERQRKEKLETQKKKRAEQARKKKEKEEEEKQNKAKQEELAVKAEASKPSQSMPPKKSTPSKKIVKPRGGDLGRKATHPAARPAKRKPKTQTEKVLDFLKDYPVCIGLSLLIIVVAMFLAIY